MAQFQEEGTSQQLPSGKREIALKEKGLQRGEWAGFPGVGGRGKIFPLAEITQGVRWKRRTGFADISGELKASEVRKYL